MDKVLYFKKKKTNKRKNLQPKCITENWQTTG